MYNVGDIIKSKGNNVWAVHSQTKVSAALQLMAEKNIGAVLVMDHRGNSIKGIFSERDYARYSILHKDSDICPLDLPVDDLMSKDVLFIDDTKTIEDCTRLMSSKHLRHLPVLHDGELSGIISITDLVQTLLRKQDFIIDQMEQYISGEKLTYFYRDTP